MFKPFLVYYDAFLRDWVKGTILSYLGHILDSARLWTKSIHKHAFIGHLDHTDILNYKYFKKRKEPNNIVNSLLLTT